MSRDLAPPVEEGDVRTVTIEGMGEEGDALARVERGFVIFVQDQTIRKGTELEVVITDVSPNVAFAEPT